MSTNVFSMKVQILETLFFVSPTRDGTNILLGARAVWCFSTCHTVTVLFFYPQCLLFTALPFAEDLRQFSFAPLEANKKWKPTGNLYNLSLNLIAIKLDPKRVFLMHGLNESYIFCKRNERQLS